MAEYAVPTVIFRRVDNEVRCTLGGPSLSHDSFSAWLRAIREVGFVWNGLRGPDGYNALDVQRARDTLEALYSTLARDGIACDPPFDAYDRRRALTEDYVLNTASETTDVYVESQGHDTYTLTVRGAQWPWLDEYFIGKHGPLKGVHTRDYFYSQRYVLTGIPYVRDTLDRALQAAESVKRSTHGRHQFRWYLDAFLADEARAQASDAATRAPIPEAQALLAPPYTLAPHQNQMIRRMVEAHGKLIVGDQMGLGKTLQALTYCAMQKQRMIVVCPKNVQGNWIKEAVRFIPSWFKGYTLEGTPRNLREVMRYNEPADFRLVTINYTNIDTLDVFAEWFAGLEFDDETLEVTSYAHDVAIVVDESHRIKETKSKSTKTLLRMGQYAQTRFAMSGTPIKNSAGEVWAQLEFVRPGYIASRSVLAGRYTPASIRQQMVRDGVYMGRTLESAGVVLPAKTSIVVDVPMPDVEDPVIESIGDISRERARFCRDRAPYVAGRVLDILDEADDTTILLFTDFVSVAVDVAAMINEEQPGAAVVHTGSTPDDERTRIRYMFDPSVPGRMALRGKTRVVCATTASLKEGSNMQEINTVIFADLPWTSTDLQQAEARVWRTGQNKEISVYWIATEGSAWDDHMASTIERKMVLTEALNKGKILTPEETKFARESISEQEILAKFGRKKPA